MARGNIRGDKRGEKGDMRGEENSPLLPRPRDELAMRAPVTVVASTFEDLVAIGLRQVISEDENLELLADRVPLDELEQAIKQHEPSVVLLNFGSLPNSAYVYQLHQQAP